MINKLISASKDIDVNIFFIIYIFNPFIGMLFLLIWRLFVNPVSDKNTDNLLCGFMILYICLIQMTRVLTFEQPSDWANIIFLGGLYSQVPTHTFCQFIFLGEKEPLWNLIIYSGYYLFNNHPLFLIDTIIIISIVLVSISIIRYCNFMEADTLTLIASLVLFLFFSEYFGILQNLTRQMFALSIITYVYVDKIVTQKTKWWLLISTAFIHTFMVFFILLFLFKSLYSKIQIKQLIYVLLILVVVIIIIQHINIFRFSMISYGIDRISNASHPLDQNRLSPVAIYISTVIISTICIIMLYGFKLEQSQYFYTNLLLFIMLICASITKIAPELMSRLYVSRFLIWPFVLPFFMQEKKMIHNLVCYYIIIFFFSRFFVDFDYKYVENGINFFPEISNIVKRSIFGFI
jgi:hypothetical protein